MIVSALLLSILGMGCFALAMRRHHRQVFRRDPKPAARIGLRVAGSVSLALSLIACAEAWGWPIGSVAWFGMLSAGALIVVAALSMWSARGRKIEA
jgi:hypothetical protein